MVYLQAYFDESGKKDDHSILSFCGLVGTNDQWGQFVPMWMRTSHNVIDRCTIKFGPAVSQKEMEKE